MPRRKAAEPGFQIDLALLGLGQRPPHQLDAVRHRADPVVPQVNDFRLLFLLVCIQEQIADIVHHAFQNVMLHHAGQLRHIPLRSRARLQRVGVQHQPPLLQKGSVFAFDPSQKHDILQIVAVGHIRILFPLRLCGVVVHLLYKDQPHSSQRNVYGLYLLQQVQGQQLS